MRRSNSASHIPLPRSEARSHSKLGARNNKKDSMGSARKGRPQSMERLALPGLKRTSSLASLSKRNTTPNLKYQTPSTSRSRSRSPFKLGSAKKNERFVNDKKWVAEQFAKVRRFLMEHPTCPENLPNQLKPPTVNTFVQVMNILLKEIDPNILINTTNYKEVVFEIVKLLHYPGIISMSFLKTVNTLHSWPQVVGLWSWFVDLNLVLIRVNLDPSPDLQKDITYKKFTCVLDFIIERYQKFNANEDLTVVDENFSKKFAKLLDVDEEELTKLNKEAARLQDIIRKQECEITEFNKKNEQRKQRLDGLQYEIDTYYTEKQQKEEEMDEQLKAAAIKREKLRDLVRKKKESVGKLEETVSKQQCTLAEKKQIKQKIEDMKHKIDLYRERKFIATDLRTQCEIKLTEIKKTVETKVFHLNNTLMKLSVLESKYQVLYMKESDILAPDFHDKLDLFGKKLKDLNNEVGADIKRQKLLIDKQKTEMADLERQKVSVEEACRLLIQKEDEIKIQIEKWTAEMNKLLLRRDKGKKAFVENMRNLDDSKPNLQEKKLVLADLQKRRTQRAKDFEIRKVRSVEFFMKLQEIVVKKVDDMIAIRDDILEKFAEVLKKVKDNQEEMSKDLHNLDEIK